MRKFLLFQTGYSNTCVCLVTDIQRDEQGCDLLEDPSVFQVTAVEGADAGNFFCQSANDLIGFFVVAANNYIGVEVSLAIQELGGNVLKGGDHGSSFQYLRCLLRGGSLPDADCPGDPAADAGGERDGGVHQNCIGLEHGLDLLEQRYVALERYGQHDYVSGGGCGGIVGSGNVCLVSSGLDFVGGLLGAGGVARTDDDGFSGAGPAEGESEAFFAGAAEDCDVHGEYCRMNDATLDAAMGTHIPASIRRTFSLCKVPPSSLRSTSG